MNDLLLHMHMDSAYFRPPLFPDDPPKSYDIHRRVLPPGWNRKHATSSPWVGMKPDGVPIPDQGWKVHISASREDAEETARVVADECIQQGLPFKYVPSDAVFMRMNSKYADRASSGKFITIYPGSTQQADEIIQILIAKLKGMTAPTILTDLQIADTPVHVRYGAFVRRMIGLPTGYDAYAFESGNGTIIQDRRELRFRLPEGVQPPLAVEHELARRQEGTADRILPYSNFKSLHYSNAGGVYRATSTDGRPIILKEGRRLTGLTANGSDGADRVARERWALERLRGVPGIPDLLGWHEFPDRVFLVEEYCPGSRALEWLAAIHPGSTPNALPEDFERYAGRVKRIVAQIGRILDAFHAQDLVYGDLHPANLLIQNDDSVKLVDFESVFSARDEGADAFPYVQGFGTYGRTGAEADRIRLALVHLWFLTANNAVWEFSTHRLQRDIAEATGRFNLDSDTFRELSLAVAVPSPVASLGSNFREEIVPVADELPLESLLNEARNTLLKLAAPENPEWLLPVTPGGVPWSLGKGAAGALLVLNGHVPEPELRPLVDWLESASSTSDRYVPGLFSGTAGSALVLKALGRTSAAHKVLEQALSQAKSITNPDLYAGLSGIGLACLNLGSTDAATEIGHRVAHADMSQAIKGKGLMFGCSGVALFFVRLFERTGNEVWLDLALNSAREDLKSLRDVEGGVVLLDGGNGKLLPSLATGSLGVGFALRALQHHRPNADADAVLRRTEATCLDGLWATQGLFHGRSGAVAYLRDGLQLSAVAGELLRRNTTALRQHFMLVDGSVSFPGKLQLRFSCDLEEGLAGAVYALDAAGHGHGPLPFLGMEPPLARGNLL